MRLSRLSQFAIAKALGHRARLDVRARMGEGVLHQVLRRGQHKVVGSDRLGAGRSVGKGKDLWRLLSSQAEAVI